MDRNRQKGKDRTSTQATRRKKREVVVINSRESSNWTKRNRTGAALSAGLPSKGYLRSNTSTMLDSISQRGCSRYHSYKPNLHDDISKASKRSSPLKQLVESTCSADDTDSEEDDEIADYVPQDPLILRGGSKALRNGIHLDLLLRQTLSMRSGLVEQLLDEALAGITQSGSTPVRQCAPSSVSGSASSCDPGLLSSNPSSSRSSKRPRDSEDEDGPAENDQRGSKRPRDPPPSPDINEPVLEFACPFRKHNPRKYCIKNKDWKTCALTPHHTVARVTYVSSPDLYIVTRMLTVCQEAIYTDTISFTNAKDAKISLKVKTFSTSTLRP